MLRKPIIKRSSGKKTRSQLVKSADKWFSLYVRYRDSTKRTDDWYAECITCGDQKPVKNMQAGHFMSRRYYVTRWDEQNVNAQCSGCNVWKQGEQFQYALELDKKYGDGTALELSGKARGQIVKITTPELEEIIKDAKEYLKELGIK